MRISNNTATNISLTTTTNIEQTKVKENNRDVDKAVQCSVVSIMYTPGAEADGTVIKATSRKKVKSGMLAQI